MLGCEKGPALDTGQERAEPAALQGPPRLRGLCQGGTSRTPGAFALLCFWPAVCLWGWGFTPLGAVTPLGLRWTTWGAMRADSPTAIPGLVPSSPPNPQRRWKGGVCPSLLSTPHPSTIHSPEPGTQVWTWALANPSRQPSLHLYPHPPHHSHCSGGVLLAFF